MNSRRTLRPLLVSAILPLLAAPVGARAAEWRADLRAPAPAPAAEAGVPAAAEPGCLRAATLAPGSAGVGALAPGDTLDLLLFDGEEIRVDLVERMESPLGGDAFLGSVAGGGVRDAVVLRTDEGLLVDVQDFANGRVYTVVSGAEGVTVREIDPFACAVTPTAPVEPVLPPAAELGAEEPPAPTGDQATTLVDVLVAFDAPAAAWARQNGGGITNFATMAVQKMNTVLANCGFESAFRFRLVGAMAVAAEGGTDLDGVLEATCNGTGDWAPVRAMRDAVGADIVTTLIDTGSAGGTTGLGYSLSRTPASSFSEYPYNVCAVRAVANDHTMTHEVGHNIGAGHATAVNPAEISPGPQLYDYSAGYYFTGTDGVDYHTIMAYNFDGYGNRYQSAPFFSSPDLAYQGTAVGDATHDNVRTIAQTYAAASQWRAQVVPMSYDVYFSPAGGSTFVDSIAVTLSPGKAGLPIRYTLDGSAPTVSSTLYTGPITLTQTTTIRAVTVTDGVAGPVFEATYSVSDLGTAVDAPQLAWRTSDALPWTFQTTNTYDGVDAAQSADDGSYWSDDAWLETTVDGPTLMSFRYKMRTGMGTFSLLVDGSASFADTRSRVDSDDWHLAEVSIPAGQHTARFLFENKGSRYSGYNGAWLDTVQFDALSRPPTLSPATTDDESTATTFRGSLSVSLVPPEGRSGFLYYTVDGSDPAGESALAYDGPIVLTKSTRVRAVFVEGGKEPSVETAGLYLERHPIGPGEWTTDVAGAQEAAARDGRLVAVLLADLETCTWCQAFDPVAESPEFLAWAKANGIYLVTADSSRYVDTEAADAWFWQLYGSYGDSGGVGYPTIFFARPDDPDTAVGKGVARNDGSSRIGTELYLDTVESLVAGFASVLGETVLAAPTCSRTDPLVDSFPFSVTLSNPNGSGTIYYTLDGSAPTPSNGTPCAGGDVVVSAGDVLQAAVWPASGLSSPVFLGAFKTVADILGTTGIDWSHTGAGCWREGADPGTLRAGGLADGTYTATLRATVSGRGRLVFSYSFLSWTWQNTFSFAVDGTTKWSYAYDGTTTFSGVVTNEVTSESGAAFEWTCKVGDASRDRASVGAWLSGVRWIPERDGVEVEGVFLPADWFAAHFPDAATDAATRTALAQADPDGDGFANWKECLCGTDPNDAADHLRATIRMEGGEPVVGWNLETPLEGASCVVEGAASLPAAESAWTSPPPSGARFFRVRVDWPGRE